MTRYNNCSCADCKRVAMWKPTIVIMDGGLKKGSFDPIKVSFNFVVCMICQAGFEVKDLVDVKGFDRISKTIVKAGYSEPVYEDMKLEWESLAGGRP